MKTRIFLKTPVKNLQSFSKVTNIFYRINRNNNLDYGVLTMLFNYLPISKHTNETEQIVSNQLYKHLHNQFLSFFEVIILY